ncbi:Pep3/Vps18/deep orange family-domain-containing protein [Kockovaella imperatae]|uniref:Pep3/Vps18/deep orange family-domain-containing protein n=1 Tax=Kockovaella imperatae TaxID=4999 RepID=A0A1Y1UHD5_9TREE|nr:Pep3/Vps18/deep orange family-domain-containing protein [Kockovaella imperatae]ORX36495.1 Pep3/Vps18/deep orange family-domain-containing protein [Kockovaella imperatae]
MHLTVVERAAGPSTGARHTVNGISSRTTTTAPLGISDVEYEGFEKDEGHLATQDDSVVQTMETGFIPSARLTNSALPPLFSLSLVQYTPPSSLICLTAANNVLFLAAAPLTIIIIDLDKPDELVTVDLPRPAQEKGQTTPSPSPVIKSLFVDPRARHLLITTTTGDTFYLPISPGNPAVQSRRARPLRLRQTITSVAWSPYAGSTDPSGGDHTPSKNDQVTPPSTDILLGTLSGQILSMPLPPQDDIFKSVSISMTKPLERDLQSVYSVPDGRPVTGLAFGFWPSTETSRGTKARRAWTVITTQERIYELQGEVGTAHVGGKTGGWAEELFKPFREGTPSFQELPGQVPNSQLCLYSDSTEHTARSSLPSPSAMAWLTAPGLYASVLTPLPTAKILVRPSLLRYPSVDDGPKQGSSIFQRGSANSPGQQPIPLAVTITKWHWLLLYSDRIVGVSRETEKVVYNEAIPVASGENVIGLSSDPAHGTYWVSTDRSIFEVLIQDEDRDVWRAKLEKGEFQDAHHYAKTPAQKDIVLSREADSLFEQGKYILAAQTYAKSTRSFEFVALRFVDSDERDPLRIYLSEKLNRLDKKLRTQRMMLATWLVEIYLSKCNTLEDIVAAESATSDVESLTIERQMMEEDMRNFITTYQNDLEPKVVYELIMGHGRTDLYLFYCNLMKDYEKVIEHWIEEQEWAKAIDVLNRQDSLEPYYRFASVLIRHAPRPTVDSWCRRSKLVPRKLIPAILQYKRSPNQDLSSDQAIRYLTYLVNDLGSTETIVYNLLITLYATDSDPDDAHLLRFLTTCPDNPLTEAPYYDLDYALRLCRQRNRIQPCIHIYSKMGMYENSVDLALQRGDLELAKANADRPEGDDVLRKKLWLKVAKYVVQERKDIKSAMKFLESTDLVKIEDILPFFPDFVVIDDFKAEICTALEEYSAKIEELKAEMEDATASADSIKRDIEGLRNRFVTVEQGDKCWKCGLPLLTRQFYVFPCQHSFHADCLISMAMETLPSATLRRILQLQNELVVPPGEAGARPLLSASHAAVGSGSGTPRKSGTQITSGSAATDLLLGVTGRNKLMAAGDRLRELIVPDALAQAVSVSVGVGKKTKKKTRVEDNTRTEEARKELDELVAAVCPLCEGAVVGLDKPFIKPEEAVGDWDI